MTRHFLPFITLLLAGCSIETARQQSYAYPEVQKVSMPLTPVVPIAVASKKVRLKSEPAVGLNNPGAEPGQSFGSGGTSECGYRWTSKGWVTSCPAPLDGTAEFDPRNPARL